MFCSNCGSPIPQGSLFCGNCGTKLGTDYNEAPSPQSSTSASYTQPSAPAMPSYGASIATAAVKSKAWLTWLIGGLSLVLAASFVFLFFFTNIFKSDEDLINERIEEFVSSYNNGDMEAVMECFDQRTKSIMGATVGIGEALIGGAAGFDVSMSDMFGLGAGLNEGDMLKLRNIQFTVPEGAVRVSVNAEITMSISFMGQSQSQSSPIQIEMVKEDGDWFISNIIE